MTEAHSLHLHRAHPASMHTPIRLDTVADLLDRGHTLGLYCERCDRWATALRAAAAHGWV